MRVLLTGVSSFTGCWIAEALAASGAAVVATCRQPLHAYAGLARRRLDKASAAGCELLEGVAFGDPAFLAALRSHGPFDLLCHHGAEVGDLRRPDYDPLAALAANTRDAATVLRRFADSGGRGLVVTGSVFEADEGGSGGAAVNAYGLAKTLTWQALRFHAERCGLGLGRFVIPHPFGPLEKPGFTGDLVRSWLAGRPACVRRPGLVRDLVHVDMLAAAYVELCHDVLAGGVCRSAPSGYVGNLLDLARLLARELRPRLDRPCELTAPTDPEPIDEPTVRINDGPRTSLAASWPTARSWDRYATFHIFGEHSSISS
jgi:nucleoside-diphosphate-sugar epimerase